jgi:hypothetical protein
MLGVFFEREPEMSVETRGRDSARWCKLVGCLLIFGAVPIGIAHAGTGLAAFAGGIIVFAVGRILE